MLRFLATTRDNLPVAGRTPCVAEYKTGAGDDDHSGLLDPLNNLSKINFHSDLDYPRQGQIVKSTDAGMAPLDIPATPSNTSLNVAVQLFAHGRPVPPIMSGSITTDGYLQPCVGSTMPIPGGVPANMGYRWLTFTADDTWVYMHIRGFYSPAMLIHWTVRVLDEAFQTRSDNDDLIYFDPETVDVIGFGKIDDQHRFLRKTASGPGEFRIIGGQTMSITKSSGTTRQFNVSDGQTHTARPARGGLGAYALTPQLTATGVECTTGGGYSPRGDGFHWDEDTGPILATSTDDAIWTTSQASMVSLGNIATTVNTSQHNAVDFLDTGLHITDHDLGPVPAGTERLEGWATMVSSGGALPPSFPFPMSGTMMMLANATLVAPTLIEFTAFQQFSPIIYGGHAYLREEWWNYTSTGSYIPALEFAVDMRSIAFVGGH